MVSEVPFEIDSLNFRRLHPNVSIGTASDRYAGWIGQIYSDGRYKISQRSKNIRRKSFLEKVLPVESVCEYFQHFSFLEIDSTYYNLLLDKDLKPTPNYHLLKRYKGFLDDADDIFLKVPQAVISKRVFRDGKFIDNSDYLNPTLFTIHFFEPALEILGNCLKGFIFEQEYHAKKARIPGEEFIDTLDGFLDAIPRDDRYHFEIRTQFYLTKLYFNMLEKYGVGQVLSHWTWLPPLSSQFSKGERRFLNSGKQSLVRLITPFGMRYETSYEKAFPFDKIIDGMIQPEMIDETVMLMKAAIDEDVHLNISINNRAGGNAPIIARMVSDQFLKRLNKERKK